MAGAIALGFVVGWLTVFVQCPPDLSRWRTLFFAIVFWTLTLLLVWNYTGYSGLLLCIAGLITGAATLTMLRYSIRMSNRSIFLGE
ncbi:hypothetical protein [Bradyrhizobium sp. LA6.10]|uniref:hypothetical protein n=1 Tax=Bradyrhizobium sp. LA6.10 TaxID=3156318 RepID=UPI0033935AED